MTINKTPMLSESINMTEVIEGGGTKKKPFLVLGDLAIQLNGD